MEEGIEIYLDVHSGRISAQNEAAFIPGQRSHEQSRKQTCHLEGFMLSTKGGLCSWGHRAQMVWGLYS